jgi:hypothetical protein
MSKSKRLRKIEQKIKKQERKIEQKMLMNILREMPTAELKLQLVSVRQVLVERKEHAAAMRKWRNMSPEERLQHLGLLAEQSTRSSVGRAVD